MTNSAKDSRSLLLRVLLHTVVMSLIPASTALGQNLVVNPGFDTDLSSWGNPFNRTAEWDMSDEFDNPASGSVRLVHDLIGNNGSLAILVHCVDVVPGDLYVFGGSFLVPTGQPDVELTGSVRVVGYPDADCVPNDVGDFAFSSIAQALDAWQPLSGVYVAPEGVHSARLLLAIGKASGVTEDTFLYVDNVYFERLEPLIFFNGFETTDKS